jgi:hypothetical protein
MIECIFTIDYEVYGNGEGSLKHLVYEPAERLKAIFQAQGKRFVVFVEVAELEMIEAIGTDPAINLVKHQIRDFYRQGFELGLHLHPQWYKGQYQDGRWVLDYSEYNLCMLPRRRIVEIVNRSIAYFRKLLDIADFTPFSFRAGNWLFQPTKTVATVLAERGVKVDSSVFKGGLQHQYKLDYRQALRNGYYWTFMDQVDVPDPQGALLELPIHTQMVPSWKMLTAKRIGLQRKASSVGQIGKSKLGQLLDLMRFRYPLKFDFCRMTISELIHMLDGVVGQDRDKGALFQPLVAIGHTKDLVDFDAVESLLSYIGERGIPVSTFEEVYPKCQ